MRVQHITNGVPGEGIRTGAGPELGGQTVAGQNVGGVQALTTTQESGPGFWNRCGWRLLNR